MGLYEQKTKEELLIIVENLEKKVEKENKQPQKERREIYFELRSFNIYSSSRRKR